MKLFDSELQYLTELYLKLNAELASLEDAPDAETGGELPDAVLRNSDLLARIQQMNVRLAQLVREWQSFRPQVDPAARARTEKAAAAAGSQAKELVELCARRVGALHERREYLARSLQELGRGALYLDSIRPVKGNYPKFIDSVG